jgi:hypothetical protein
MRSFIAYCCGQKTAAASYSQYNYACHNVRLGSAISVSPSCAILKTEFTDRDKTRILQHTATLNDPSSKKINEI